MMKFAVLVVISLALLCVGWASADASNETNSTLDSAKEKFGEMKSAVTNAVGGIGDLFKKDNSSNASNNTGVDWASAKATVGEIKSIFTNAMSGIGALVKQANAEALSSKLDSAIALGQTIFGKLEKGIEEKKLTVDEAQALFEEMKQSMTGLKTEIISEVGKTSPEDGKKVEEAFEAAKAQCEPKRDQLYATLKA